MYVRYVLTEVELPFSIWWYVEAVLTFSDSCQNHWPKVFVLMLKRSQLAHIILPQCGYSDASVPCARHRSTYAPIPK